MSNTRNTISAVNGMNLLAQPTYVENYRLRTVDGKLPSDLVSLHSLLESDMAWKQYNTRTLNDYKTHFVPSVESRVFECHPLQAVNNIGKCKK